MAEICTIVATSHSPMLSIPADLWLDRIDGDRESYAAEWDAAVRANATTFEAHSTPEALAESEAWVAAGIQRLADTLKAADPDFVIIVGDDQDELLPPGVTVPFMTSTAESLFCSGLSEAEVSALPGYRRAAIDSQGRDADRSYLISDQALPLATALGAAGEPVGLLEVQMPGTRFGHAFSFVIHRLLNRNMSLPIIPIMLNTFLPRVQPSAPRCLEFGTALGRCISEQLEGRVAVVASGGLSHRMIDRSLDDLVVDALRSNDPQRIADVPDKSFTDQKRADGNGEIKNWLTVAAVAKVCGWQSEYVDYRPLYRSPAGTGVGAAFAEWSQRD